MAYDGRHSEGVFDISDWILSVIFRLARGPRVGRTPQVWGGCPIVGGVLRSLAR